MRNWIQNGINKFKFPVVGDNINVIVMVDVEVHVGEGVGLNQQAKNRLFTVVIKQEHYGLPLLMDCIDQVALNIKIWLEAHLEQVINSESMRWYVVIPYHISPLHVTFFWDTDTKRFTQTLWSDVDKVNLEYETTPSDIL